MKRYLSTTISLLIALSLSAVNLPSDSYSTDSYSPDAYTSDLQTEDYGSEEVGATYPVDEDIEPSEITVTVVTSAGTQEREYFAYSDQAYEVGDVVTYGGLSWTLASTATEDIAGETVTVSAPGYLFPVGSDGKIAAIGGASIIFKMPLDENLAVILMLVILAAGYGVVMLRRNNKSELA